VVVEEEWPPMRQGQTSPHAQALTDELRSAIQEFEPSTTTEQLIYAQELDAVNDLDKSREARVLDARLHLPPILWTTLLGFSINMLSFSCLVGIEDTRLHMFGVSVLMAGIALVLCTIFVLERPFGTAFQVGPQAFEMLVHTIEGTGQQ
jgi:hypothetical protein